MFFPKVEYIGFFQNGGNTVKYSLEDIQSVFGLEYIIRAGLEYHNGYLNKRFMRLIEPDGTPKLLRIGGFELLYIGDSGSKVTIREAATGKIFEEQISVNPYKYMYDAVLPLFEKLNEVGTYGAYLVYLENASLKAENETLRFKIAQLQSD